MEVQADSDIFRVLGLWLHNDWGAPGDCFVVRDFLHDVVRNELFNSALEWFNEMVWDTSRFLGIGMASSFIGRWICISWPSRVALPTP